MGYLSFIGTDSIMDRDVARHTMALVDWASTKIKRVVKSTLAAEAASFSFGYDKAVYLRAILGELENGPRIEWEDHLADVPQLSSTDCRSLYDLLEKDTGMPQEKRVALDVYDVRQYLAGGDEKEWLPTGMMMADVLTKHRPWMGPMVDALLGDIVWRETPEERDVRPVGQQRHRMKAECTDVDD